MEVKLLDRRLTLHVNTSFFPYRMNEEKLRRHVLLLVGRLRFQRQVPNRELVVARHRQHRRVVRTPLDRRDRRIQVAEVSHGATPTRHPSSSLPQIVAEIPHAERSIVASRNQQVAHLTIPADHIHV